MENKNITIDIAPTGVFKTMLLAYTFVTAMRYAKDIKANSYNIAKLQKEIQELKSTKGV